MPSNRQEANVWAQRVPCQQQDQAPFSAQFALSPLLGRERKPLDQPARLRQRAAHHRQEWHRRSVERPARYGGDLVMREKIKLESTAGTGHFYTTTKNKRTMPCLLYTSDDADDLLCVDL